MNRTLSRVIAAASCIILITFYGCNDEKSENGKHENKRGIPYDEARAKKSIISLDQATRYQEGFVKSRAELGRLIKDTSYLSKNFNLPNAETFSRDAIILLLNQPGADGIRLYYGKDKEGKVRLVLLPVTKEGKDIYNRLIAQKPASDTIAKPSDTTQPATPEFEQAETIENGQICPPCIMKRFDTQFW